MYNVKNQGQRLICWAMVGSLLSPVALLRVDPLLPAAAHILALGGILLTAAAGSHQTRVGRVESQLLKDASLL